jgi:uncharacterized protein (DUF58 family)
VHNPFKAHIQWPAITATHDIAEHPLFKGPLSRWLGRWYMERVTPAGQGFFLATVFFTHFAICSLDIHAYVAFSYAAALWTVALLTTRFFKPRVSMSARYADRICVGEVLPVDVEVTRLGGLCYTDLQVRPHRLPASVDAVPTPGATLPPLTGKSRTRVRIGLLCNRRGVHRLQGFRVETGYPFGLITAPRHFSEERALLVYPRFTPLARLEVGGGRRFHPGGVAFASSVGDATEFLGNREFRQGDSIRDVDWKATARLQRPVVREYREEYFLRVAIVLDTHLPHGSEPVRAEAFERAVSVGAAVSDYMSRQEYLIDLFAAGPDLYHLTAGRNLAFVDQILDILACVESRPSEPFESIEPQIAENLAQISVIICIFLDWNESRRQFVQRLRARGSGFKIIFVRDGAITLDPEADRDILGNYRLVTAEQFQAGIDEL